MPTTHIPTVQPLTDRKARATQRHYMGQGLQNDQNTGIALRTQTQQGVHFSDLHLLIVEKKWRERKRSSEIDRRGLCNRFGWGGMPLSVGLVSNIL